MARIRNRLDSSKARRLGDAPVYSASPNAVDGGATSTIGIGLFKGRRLI